MNKDKFTRRWVYPYLSGKVVSVGNFSFSLEVREQMGDPLESSDPWTVQFAKPPEWELKMGETVTLGFYLEPKKVVG